MDCEAAENNEFSASECAFWHTNMDLYYGYQLGEVVEVEHEFNKYWLATIKYSFKHLILLKWIGNYGEFWIDTSMQNLTSASNHVFDEITGPRRLFPPGYHLQSQLKSQFTLERPSKVLVKPSLYNPTNDPYAEIKTVEDLLAHEVSQEKDAFGNKTSSDNSEAAGLAMATCKTTIAYGQEDVDELEAALLNLTETWGPEAPSDSTYGSNVTSSNSTNTNSDDNSSCTKSGQDNELSNNHTPLKSEVSEEKQKLTPEATSRKLEKSKKQAKDEDQLQPEVDHDSYTKICRTIQDSAITKGRYLGVEENSKKVYYLKPKQFFDLGGANHERAIVAGTLLEICQSHEGANGFEIFHWFATVIKNIGGRLKLRWFLCDEPKFKQGRLELKSCKSEFIREEEDDESSQNDEDKCGLVPRTRIPLKEITFCMHFCNPCIYSINHGSNHDRLYQMPQKIFSFIESMRGKDEALKYESIQLDYIFDHRRMNLDKERPIIDHLLSTVRWLTPKYIDLSFASKDTNNSREVLLSTPKTTKLLKGHIHSEIAPGVFEVHSEPLQENGEIIKFVYPYDSSYSILPLDWATNNQDCLSVNPSRNPTPTLMEKTTLPADEQTSVLNDDEKAGQDALKLEENSQISNDATLDNKPKHRVVEIEPFTLLCEIAQSSLRQDEIDFVDENLTRPEDFDEQEPTCWSRLIRISELRAPEFVCKLNYSFRDDIASRFKIMDQLEVVHPSSDVTICLGRIRKIAYPLLWIQISADSYTLLPFNSTEIYPNGWCESNSHPLISLLPPRKRLNQPSQPDKKRKKVRSSNASEVENRNNQKITYEKEHFDLGALNDKQLDIDYILNEKSMYIRIYFNHKCFTGPSLSKGKICSLPQYVGPGPLRLVMEEVVTKVISVAYVPPRILNDLSSKTFEDLLIARNLTNTTPMEFKAKYQKRVHREDIPVCLSLDDVALYCECVCEHLKCCYNLFGPNLYDGDDCPGHCRALTKSNKFMKRATYYREKARLGEFVNDSGSSKKSTNANNSSNKTSRARYAGRDSSESTSSSVSRSEQVNSRASSSAGDEAPINELKENLVAVEEMENEDEAEGETCTKIKHEANEILTNDVIADITSKKPEQPETDKIIHSDDQKNLMPLKQPPEWSNESEFNMLKGLDLRPSDWTVEDVGMVLRYCSLDSFNHHMMSEVSL